METLPEEMVHKIGRQLTVEDLAHCCGVSKGWREAFNQDRLWKPFCNTALEEHLRTTPSIVEPVFDVSGGEGSTLVPICKWRLAFLREKHLKNNWKHNYRRTEAVLEVKDELYREFLTNTLIVKWFPDRFQVWDISSDPAVLATEYCGDWLDSFVENGWLIVRLLDSIKVFTMDANNKTVLLKCEIPFEDVKTVPDLVEYERQLNDYKGKRLRSGLECVKGNILVHVNAIGGNLDIFNIDTGKRIKEEPCPSLVNDGTEKRKILRVFTSPTSSYVVVIVNHSIPRDNFYYHIYDPQKLSFLEGHLPGGAHLYGKDYGEIHSDYLLVPHYGSVTVYSVQSFEVLVGTEPIFSIGLYDHGSKKFLSTGANSINMFDLQSRTKENIEGPSVASGSGGMFHFRNYGTDYRIFNKKLLVYRLFHGDTYLLLENSWVKCDLDFERGSAINAAFTKVISQEPPDRQRDPDRRQEWYIYHYW